jgi:hypothetical protein
MAVFQLQGPENLKNYFVRIGTLAEGACFYESFLLSLCGRNNLEKTKSVVRTEIERFRKKIAEYFTFENFKKLKSLGGVFDFYFNEAFEKFPEDKKSLIFHIFTNYAWYNSLSVDEIMSQLQEQKAKEFYEEVLDKAWRVFQRTLQRYRTWADNAEILIVGKIFNVNILILDDEGKLVQNDQEIDKTKPCILLYYFNRVAHYESVGIKKEGTEKVMFTFSADDEIVAKLKARTERINVENSLRRAQIEAEEKARKHAQIESQKK